MTGALRAVVAHDLSIAWRRRSSLLASVVFFVIVCSLFPLAIGPDPQQLRALAPGILWVAALLASMLSLSRLFTQEYADGSLDHRPTADPGQDCLCLTVTDAPRRLTGWIGRWLNPFIRF